MPSSLLALCGRGLKWLVRCLLKVSSVLLLPAELSLWQSPRCLVRRVIQELGRLVLILTLTRVLLTQCSRLIILRLELPRFVIRSFLVCSLVTVLPTTPRQALKLTLVTNLSRLVFSRPFVLWTLRLRTVTPKFDFRLENLLTVCRWWCVLDDSSLLGGESRQ